MVLLFVLWVVFTMVQISIWWYLSSSLTNPEPEEAAVSPSPAVSIIIAAKNEAENLRKHLPLILGQDYPDFEVLVIDDHSSDDTGEVVAGFFANYPRLKLIALDQDSGKKQAVIAGISHARSPWLGFIDADCYPGSSSWISTMMKSPGRSDVCLGYGPYEEEASLINRFIRFETWYIGLLYFSLALHKKPYMGVGRNLFYKKDVFLSSDQMTSHLDLLSGDDDLFISSLGPQTKFSVVLEPPSYTYSIPARSWGGYFCQKSRHISTAVRYPKYIKMMLLAMHSSHLGVYLCTIWVLIACSFWIGILLLAVRFILVFIFSKHCLSLLVERNLLRHTWYLDGLLAVFYAILSFKLFTRPNTWKK